MNATSSGVAFSAAKMRSPSFSRSSSSITTTALPAAISAIALSTESSLVICATLPVRMPDPRSGTICRLQYEPPKSSGYCQLLLTGTGHQPFHVLGDDVDFEIDRRPHGRLPQRGELTRGGDQRHLEPLVSHGRHRQRHPVDGDRALLHHIPRQRGRQADAHDFPVVEGRAGNHSAGAVHVALHDVTAEATVHRGGPLQVYLAA